MREAKCNQHVIAKLEAIGKELSSTIDLKVMTGKTLCTNDFYEGETFDLLTGVNLSLMTQAKLI